MAHDRISDYNLRRLFAACLLQAARDVLDGNGAAEASRAFLESDDARDLFGYLEMPPPDLTRLEPPEGDGWLTVRQVGEMVGISPSSIRFAIRSGKLKPDPRFKPYRIAREEAARWGRERRKRA